MVHDSKILAGVKPPRILYSRPGKEYFIFRKALRLLTPSQQQDRYYFNGHSFSLQQQYCRYYDSYAAAIEALLQLPPSCCAEICQRQEVVS